VACSGAAIDDVPEQLRTAAASSAPANLVTITIGGNDVGFASVLADCLGVDDILDRVFTGRRGCLLTEDELRSRAEALPARLVPLYTSIRSDLAKGSALVVIGYPSLFADPSEWLTPVCYGVSKSDAAMLRRVAVELDARIRDAATRSGATYVPMIDAFKDHELCGAQEQWINGLSSGVSNGTFRGQSTFHPNEAGQRAEAEVLARVLLRLYGVN